MREDAYLIINMNNGEPVILQEWDIINWFTAFLQGVRLPDDATLDQSGFRPDQSIFWQWIDAAAQRWFRKFGPMTLTPSIDGSYRQSRELPTFASLSLDDTPSTLTADGDTTLVENVEDDWSDEEQAWATADEDEDGASQDGDAALEEEEAATLHVCTLCEESKPH